MSGYPVMMPIGDRSPAKDVFPMGQEFERQAQRNHGQSLRRLAERGGLGWCEARWIIEGKRWGDTVAVHPSHEPVVRAALATPNAIPNHVESEK